MQLIFELCRDKITVPRKLNSAKSQHLDAMGEEYSLTWQNKYSTMDHEKSEAVVPQEVDHLPGGQGQTQTTQDVECTGPPSINEAENVDDPKDHRGESVW